MSKLHRSAATALALSVLAGPSVAQGVVATGSGFVISVDAGDGPAQVSEDFTAVIAPPPTSARTPQSVDVQIEAADIAVTFDGLDVKRRLDAIVLTEGPTVPGQVMRVQSQLNYPAFVRRAEFRVLDLGARGGPRNVQVIPVAPNGVAQFTLPDDSEDLVLTHRVYDARGRYDETAPIPLRADEASIARLGDLAVEEGTSTLARARIPVHGGAVTVRGDNILGGAQVQTLGETILPDPSGSFVIQRILPPGDHPVQVQVDGRAQALQLERDITVPANEWFYTGTVDLTFGRRFDDPKDANGASLPETYSYGRIAAYAKGKVRGGWTLTGSIDTNETDLDEIFEDFDKKDPYSTLLRMSRESAYPTYGDDSMIEDDTPSDGKFYLRAERDGSHLMWGNFKSTIGGTYYLRNERELYGFQGVYRSPAQTTHGESRVSVEGFAATPDSLPGREVFRGTGGSVYFLQNADLAIGSETVTVQLRDKDTGRVVSTSTLAEGRDYTINYTQGSVILNAPLTGSTGGGLVVTNPGGEYDVNLVVQYEYTPAAGQVDGTNFGARAEVWLNDYVRLGATRSVERTGFADQTATGADLRLRFSEETYLDLEQARTDGPGFGSSFSSNGGLVVSTDPVANGTGDAWLARGRVGLADAGLGMDGYVAGYYEKRDAGFSTLDYQITDDEELWGVSAEFLPSEAVALRFYYDDARDDAGKKIREGGAELDLLISSTTTLSFGIEHVDIENPAAQSDDTGGRTDIAARLTVEPRDGLKYYVFGQATAESSGGLEKNDRIGAGVSYRFNENWTIEGEVSDGTQGLGGALLFTRQGEGTDNVYLGYRLEPGRDFSGVTLSGEDRGTFVAGGRRQVSDDVTYFGENTYDLFGRHRALTSAYGVEYRATEQTVFFGALEVGRVDDAGNDDDYDRNGVSLGIRHDNGAGLQAKARLEYRVDEGTLSGTDRDLESFLLSAGATYEIDEERRLLFNLDYSEIDANNASLQAGTYSEVTLGYAVRPIFDDRFNLLFKYRYLFDSIGQEIDGTDQYGPRQESHVLSIDAEYDLNQQWSVGGKLGGRWSRSSPDETVPFAENDAWLAVANARWHVVHNWDLLIEARHLEAEQAGISETSAVGTIYRHFGNNFKAGIGYNFGTFSDDLTDLTYDDKGAFVNLIAKF
ncbi:hypothetical protein [Roseivivax sp. THAF197b]|uniref:hypothetical protein n=1 Tax=Roseivivax sp. THAF197b TaxID=2588299 RepID=UPI0012687DC2|nr:hypothetical protein [Roseivivax sp. THAF197b]QFS84945.1 hypothetical protein FIV09_19040 [Roseivivax sp. THAF197b]